MATIYEPVRINGMLWYVAEEYRTWVNPGGPMADLSAIIAAGKVVKDLKIKRTLDVTVGGIGMLVKEYRSASFLQRMRSKFLGSRAMAEMTCLNRALTLDVPTLPFVAVAERGDESYVFIAKAPDRERLDELYSRLTDVKRRHALVREYGRWAKFIHEVGLKQYDFNPTNVLALKEGGPDLRLIDYERVEFTDSMSEEERLRSLAKIDRMMEVPRTDRLRFLVTYCGAKRAKEIRETVKQLSAYTEEQRDVDAERRRDGCVNESRNYGRFERDGAWGWYRKFRPGSGGIEEKDLAALDNATRFRRTPVDRAIESWQSANAVREGERPVAVVLKGSEKSGALIFGPLDRG